MKLLTIIGQVDAHVHRKEVVYFSLRAVHGGELLRRDVHELNRLSDLHVLWPFHMQKIL